jgi:hypothetical protein
MDREALFATSARVHEHLQSDRRERAACAAEMPSRMIDVLLKTVCDRVHSVGANYELG